MDDSGTRTATASRWPSTLTRETSSRSAAYSSTKKTRPPHAKAYDDFRNRWRIDYPLHTLHESRFGNRSRHPLGQIADIFLWPLVLAAYGESNRACTSLRDAGRFIESRLDTDEISVCVRSGPLRLPHLEGLGLGLAAELATGQLPAGFSQVAATGSYGAAAELSAGKDTPSGHWEMAGCPVPVDWGYFPKEEPCFPSEFLDDLVHRDAASPVSSAIAMHPGRKYWTGWAKSISGREADLLHLGRFRLPDRRA